MPAPHDRHDRDRCAPATQPPSARRRRCRRNAGHIADRVRPHRSRDVLEGSLAEVAGRHRQLADHLVESGGGDHDAAGLGQAFQPGGDVDAVAVEIVAVDQHVAQVDADAKADALVLGSAGLPLHHAALDVDGAGDRLDHARELDQGAVAHELDQPAAMVGQQRVDQLGAMRLQAGQGRGLGRLHQPAVADHVGRQDGCKPPPCRRFGHRPPRPPVRHHPMPGAAACLGKK